MIQVPSNPFDIFWQEDTSVAEAQGWFGYLAAR
jgi:hypothetical protein